MKFIIGAETKTAYFIAESNTEEVSLRTIFAHLVGPFPNTCRLHPATDSPTKFEYLEIEYRGNRQFVG